LPRNEPYRARTSGCWTTRAPSDSAISRVRSEGRIDHEDLVEQRYPADHLPEGAADDRTDRLLLVEGRQDERHRDALLLLELHEPAEVAELGVMEIRFAEPALHPGGDHAGLLGGAVGGGERFGLGLELVEGRPTDRLAGLHDDHRRLGPRRDRLRQ